MSKELGTLVIVVLKAQNLKDIHSFYKQDVYAQVSLNGNKKSTPVDKKGGQHPLWDTEIRFPILKEGGDKNRVLEVACWASEPKTDELLGSGKVDITETLKTGEFDDWVKLDINGTYRGDIYLEMTFFASGAAPPKAPTPTSSSPPSSYLNANVPLTRRPSKLSPKERMSRPSQPYNHSVPASLSPQAPPSQSQIQGQFSTNYTSPQRTHLGLPGGNDRYSPPSSRSSSGSPGRHGRDAVLPPLPEDFPPSDGGKGGGKVPSILRPGNPNSSLKAVSAPYSSSSSTMPGSYPNDDTTVSYRPVTGQTYKPVTGQGVSYQAPQPQPSSFPQEFNAPISFPVPQATPGFKPPPGNAYNPHATPYVYGRSPYVPQQEELPDPYLSSRYKTPLPLPQGATSSQPEHRRARNVSTSHASREEEETAKVLADITRRKRQEEEDLEFARQLDREMNL